MNKKKLIGIMGAVVVVGGVFGYIAFHNQSMTQSTNNSTKLKYEILDVNVKLPNDIQQFVTDSTTKQGVFSKQSGKDTFVVISGGKQSTTGYGIGLDSLTGQKNEIDLKYEIVAPIHPDKETKKDTYPHMTLKIDNDLRPVKGISEKPQSETPQEKTAKPFQGTPKTEPAKVVTSPVTTTKPATPSPTTEVPASSLGGVTPTSASK